MKKSEHLHYAMLAVLDSAFSAEVRLKVLETLMDRRNTELLMERLEAEGAEAEKVEQDA